MVMLRKAHYISVWFAEAQCKAAGSYLAEIVPP